MIEIRDLTIRYDDLVAVRSVSLDVPAGSVLGLVGPNGAGKTSMIRALAGVLVPDEGELSINGIDVQEDPTAIHRLIGYMPDFFGVYDYLTAREYVELFGQLHDVPPQRLQDQVAEALSLTNLSEKAEAAVGSLSRGMKQRLCLARCLVHEPDVLLLDEPASGVDPRGRYEVRQLIARLGSMGKTVLVSSHILPELAEVCDSVAILERGRLVASGSVASIAGQIEPLRVLTMRVLGGQAQRARELLQGFEPLRQIEVQGDTLELRLADDDEAMADLLARLVADGIRIGNMTQRRADLEQLYLQLTQGALA